MYCNISMLLAANTSVLLLENISYVCLAILIALLVNYNKLKNQAGVGKNEKTEMMFNQKSRRRQIEVRTEYDHQSKIYNPKGDKDYQSR